jgi:hypothetical protein
MLRPPRTLALSILLSFVASLVGPLGVLRAQTAAGTNALTLAPADDCVQVQCVRAPCPAQGEGCTDGEIFGERSKAGAIIGGVVGALLGALGGVSFGPVGIIGIGVAGALVGGFLGDWLGNRGEDDPEGLAEPMGSDSQGWWQARYEKARSWFRKDPEPLASSQADLAALRQEFHARARALVEALEGTDQEAERAAVAAYEQAQQAYYAAKGLALGK